MSNKNVYISGSFAGRDRIREHARSLTEGLGYNVVSKWYDSGYFVEKAWDQDFSGDVAKTMAYVDFSQILNVDTIIVDTIDKSSTGGSDTELGLALARRVYQPSLRIVHIGPYRNVFQNLVHEHFASWEDFLDAEFMNLEGSLGEVRDEEN